MWNFSKKILKLICLLIACLPNIPEENPKAAQHVEIPSQTARQMEKRARAFRFRILKAEKLDTHRVLAGDAPDILSLVVRGEDWSDEFVTELENEGLGSGGVELINQQPGILPWANINQITAKFDRDVNIVEENLFVQGVSLGALTADKVAEFSYDSVSNTANWTLRDPLGNDVFGIRLSDEITSQVGEPLDSPAGGFVFDSLNMLPGDIDRSGVTNIFDGLNLRPKLFLEAGQDGYDVMADIDGSGVINIFDGLLLRNALFTELPDGDLDLMGPSVSVGLVEDTSADGGNDDLITSNPVVSGVVSDPLGIHRLEVSVNSGPYQQIPISPDGTFGFTPGTLIDGDQTYDFRARDRFGNLSTVDLDFKLDTAIFISDAGLSVTSDTGVQGDNATTVGRATLVGNAEPGARVTLRETGQTVLVAGDGTFRFSSIALSLGINPFNFDVIDVAGNQTSLLANIERLDASFEDNAVLRWNREALQAIRRDATSAAEATRVTAMVHAAILDVINAIDGSTPVFVSATVNFPVSIDAAVASAAHRILLYLYPGQRSQLNAALAAAVAGIADPELTNGIQLGQGVADAIIGLRSDDGWDGFDDFVGTEGIGQWRPTGPTFALPATPHWRDLDTWLLASADQFRPDAPPSLGSVEYAAALNEVKQLGKADSSTRTTEQTEIAVFWLDGAGTVTPPGHWNQIAADAALAVGNSLADDARLFAQLNLALADSAIAAWDTKYAYSFWRPKPRFVTPAAMVML